MCGTGVGFSVERQYIAHLPEVSEEFHATDTVIGVADSKVGWASSFRELISLLYAGKVPKWDLSAIRPSGAPLKTFGGRASGPAPLEDLFRFCVEVFRGAKGRRLNSLECHDICCKIADIVVVGGVRRSALISLSNLSDDRIRRCKQGEWWMTAPHRALSNNSASYTEKPDFEAFLNEWQEMYKSKAGERGLFSRVASQKQAAKNGRRDATKEFGTNPCSEIILRPAQLCNLSEVVVRPDDTCSLSKRQVFRRY
jgi:ribonucleoside-diphosphate reductase alpha chain